MYLLGWNLELPHEILKSYLKSYWKSWNLVSKSPNIEISEIQCENLVRLFWRPLGLLQLGTYTVDSWRPAYCTNSAFIHGVISINNRTIVQEYVHIYDFLAPKRYV